MAVALAQGVPTFSGTTIPVLYPLELLVKFYNKSIIANITSTEHESELKKKGDTARIRLKPTVNRKTGAVGQDMVSERPAFSYVDLVIDKMYYYDVAVDDVIAKQSDIAIMKEYEEAIVEDNAEQTDADVLAGVDTGADAENIGTTAGIKTGFYNLGTTGSAVQISELTAVDAIFDMFAVLEEQKLSGSENIWAYIPSWYARMLKTSELKQANEMGDNSSTLRTGMIGKIDGKELYVTNNLTGITDGSNTCWYAQAGHKSAIAFAQTISEMRVKEMEKQFAKHIQMQIVYGYKVVNDDYLTSLYCRPVTS